MELKEQLEKLASKISEAISGGNAAFVVYSPNAFNKGTCDPKWTDRTHLCRGTFDTCKKSPELKTGPPLREGSTDQCWRYSFRYHLEEAREADGMMVQVVDKRKEKKKKEGEPSPPRHPMPPVQEEDDPELYQHYALGGGQGIETEMAADVGIKVFRFFEPVDSFPPYVEHVRRFVSAIQDWYQDGCQDMDEYNPRTGFKTRTRAPSDASSTSSGEGCYEEGSSLDYGCSSGEGCNSSSDEGSVGEDP